MLNYILIAYIIILALVIHQNVAFDLAKKKGREDVKARFIALIPVYGLLYFNKLAHAPGVTDKEIKNLFSFEVMAKRILLDAFIVLLGFIIVIPLSVLLYISLSNNLLQTLLGSFAFILLFLIHQGTVVDYASKKGYEGLQVGLIAMIPIYGFIHYKRKEKRRNVSKQALRNVFSFKNFVGRALIYGEISLVAIIVIVPVIYIFGMAFANLRSSIPNQLWPEDPSFEAFKYLFNETNYLKWYWNTLKIALINMFVGTILITGAAYVFARFQFKGKKAGLLTILVLQAFPSFMGLIAMYVLFWKFGLLGKPTALSILYIGGSIPGNLWLIKGFLTQIPKDLDESAMIDGANKLQIFFRIILPLAVPILTFVAVSMFMGPWMDYMLPGYLLQFYPEGAPVDYDVTTQWTLAVGLFKFINDLNYQHYSAFAAGALIVGIPIATLYMVFQRYLIEGIMAGATKG